MRAKLHYGFLVFLIGSLLITACDNVNNSGNFEESFELFTDLEPVQGASNVTAIVNKGEKVQGNFGKAAGSDSWFQIKLSGIESNDIINNGTVGAWCLEWKKNMRSNNDVHEGTKIYSTKGADKWQPMTYFFSIKNELKRDDPTLTHREFQSVVWTLAGEMGFAPEFDLTKLKDSELPSRLRENGQAIVNKEKVLSIVNRVMSEYKTKASSTTLSPTVMETEGDEQDVIIPDPPPVIEVDTNIFIYFDASGSMNSTLPRLNTMRNDLLKNALLPFYNNDETEYNNRVNVISNSSERTLGMLNLFNSYPADGSVVVLVFQDEASSVYHSYSFSDTNSRTFTFETDVAALRSNLSSFVSDPTKGSTYYRGVIFQVDGSCCGYQGFTPFIEAIQNGTGNFAPPYGLSDRSEFNYVYDVPDGGAASTYLGLVTQALTDLGFDLTP